MTSLAELGMASAVARSVLEPDDIAGTVTSISLIVSTGLAILMALSAGPWQLCSACRRRPVRSG